MPPRWEDVCQEDEVGFMARWGEGQSVEVGVGDADVLGLAALVGAHCYVAVGAVGWWVSGWDVILSKARGKGERIVEELCAGA